MALLLLLPAPSVGVLAGMVLAPDQLWGKAVFAVSKIWILLLPIFWFTCIERQKPGLSKPSHGGFGVATALGLVISAAIFIFYLTLGKLLINPQLIKDMAARTGLSNPAIYLAGAAYWILVNSVLEEYVWRWFVVRQCSALMSQRMAIALSAACFTLHHIFATQVYFSWLLVVIVSLGIFIGGALWSWCYLRYKSIWPGYVSHAIVDIAVFAIGYHLIFQ